MTEVVVITGFGPGLSEQLATVFLKQGYCVAGISRGSDFAQQFQSANDNFYPFQGDVGDTAAVKGIFEKLNTTCGPADVLIHNAAQLHIGEFLETSAEEFTRLWQTSCLGAVNVTQQVLPNMLTQKSGKIIFTGATASVKGGANFSAFASSKFALRGLSQSLARAYGPKGIHVMQCIIDGVIWGDRAEHVFKMQKDACIDPHAITATYLQLIKQPPSAWTHEIDLRPASETF